METHKKPDLGWFLFLALLIHLVTFVAIPAIRAIAPGPDGAALAPRFIEVFDDNRQIVQSLPQEDGTQTKPRFRSDRTNRIREQTRAKRHGAYQPQHSAPSSREEFESPSLPGFNSRQPLSMRDLTRLAQTPHEFDKSIREGEETLLNTDSVYYASFLNRITDAIYPAWVRRLNDATDFLGLRRHPDRLASSEYVTRLGIEMDSRGNILSVQVLKSSGVPEFDEAPRAAIWDKEPFRNPPAQMFARQDTFRFEYVFTVETHRSSYSILPHIEL